MAKMNAFVSCSAIVLITFNQSAINFANHYSKNNVINFLNENFDDFIGEYNKKFSDDLLASKINRSLTINSPLGEQLYYVDFNVGYMIISDDFVIYEISNNDLNYEDKIFNCRNVYYSGSSLYLDGVEMFEKITNTKNNQKDTLDYPSPHQTILNYNTLNDFNNQDGKLEEEKINNYITTVYAGYEIIDSSYINNYEYIYQHDTSVFFVPSGEDSFMTEGNCTLNATYSMLRNMGKQGWNKKIYTYDKFIDYSKDVKNDPHYNLIDNSGFKINDSYRIGNPLINKKSIENMSSLYFKIRELGMEYGYSETYGMLFDFLELTSERIQSQYKYNTDFIFLGDYYQIASSIRSKIPCLVHTSKSLTYGNHAMAVNGYIKLEKRSSWGIFTHIDTKWILAVDDGHSYKTLSNSEYFYYDPNKGGGANFIMADVDTLEYTAY